MTSLKYGVSCLLVAFHFYNLAYSLEALCSVDLFGGPTREDCRTLYPRVADFRDTRARLFDEEELRAKKFEWPGVENVFQTKVVQIPKYWSYSEQYREDQLSC